MQPVTILMQPNVATALNPGLPRKQRRSLDAGTHRGIVMRKVKFAAALTYACLGATSASAANVRIDGGHSATDFGVGGWSQNFSAKPFASGAVSVVSGVAKAAVNSPSDFARHDFASLRHWPLWRADAGCVFVSSTTSAGNRWRPACK